MIDDALALKIAHALLDGYIASGDFSEDGIPFAAELVKSLARHHELESALERKESMARLLRVVPGRKERS